MTLKQGLRKTSSSLANLELVLFDVDNTLVGNESPDMPTERFKAVAEKAKKHVKIGLASARGLPKLEPIMQYLEVNGPSIMLNGSQVYDYQQGKYLANWGISSDTAKELLVSLGEMGVAHWINDGGIDYFPDSDIQPAVYRKQIDEWDRQSALDKDSVSTLKNPVLVVVADISELQVKRVRQAVEATGDKDIVCYIVHENKTVSGDFHFDLLILNKQANKRHAFYTALEIEGIGAAKAMMVGDGRNDEVVVAVAGVGVAMNNATEQTLRVATHIAPSHWEDGAAVVLEELIKAKDART